MRIRIGLLALALTAGLTSTAGSVAAEDAAWEHVVSGSFGSYAALESEWNYGYPWGSDHNGTARMYGSPTDHNHVWLDGGVLNLKATRINWDEGNSSADPYLPIRYHSGAVHAKDHIIVNDRYPSYEVRGEFQAPSTRGTWPAFWLTGVNSWPPESDILEYKGNARNWFNTFRSASDVSTTIVDVASPGSWHEYRAWITKVNATDVDIHYYLDGQWVAQHRAAGFVNQPLWVIINLQMEGSAGSPGPGGDTHYRARDVYIGRSAA
ncbi:MULTISPECIES: family 16 glycosylhydrolase [Actinoalloteichus]|uniref:Glycosyl hydrolase family 16 n=1 Tax=Actinoalloteichus fjordicus TaxID=1612552 RepID=A0AAC9PTB3_9PSEU|nr:MULTISPECIES: family 16 glycosylhydrolase [Actinoalloteichus]APU15696.1 glycosyl hydrolase family 16 [Actinoalloteichus fjordicus]APU21756.1 glycosyl hydrolase family 16 [Actinoalloteichus sp. GBA129-24]